MTKRKRRISTPSDRLLVACDKYLQSVGWYAVVAGGVRIEQPRTDRKFNYELVIRFTGGRKKAR